MNATRPTRTASLSVRELADGESVVLPPDGKAALVLNATGAAVLDLCDGRRTVDEIIAFVCGVFPDMPRERIESDVTALIEKLGDAGCLQL